MHDRSHPTSREPGPGFWVWGWPPWHELLLPSALFSASPLGDRLSQGCLSTQNATFGLALDESPELRAFEELTKKMLWMGDQGRGRKWAKWRKEVGGPHLVGQGACWKFILLLWEAHCRQGSGLSCFEKASMNGRGLGKRPLLTGLEGGIPPPGSSPGGGLTCPLPPS